MSSSVRLVRSSSTTSAFTIDTPSYFITLFNFICLPSSHPSVDLRLSPWLTQTVKTMFAVRCEILDRQDHFIAF